MGDLNNNQDLDSLKNQWKDVLLCLVLKLQWEIVGKRGCFEWFQALVIRL